MILIRKDFNFGVKADHFRKVVELIEPTVKGKISLHKILLMNKLEKLLRVN